MKQMVLIGCAITMEGVLTNHVWAHRRRTKLGFIASSSAWTHRRTIARDYWMQRQ